MTQIKRIRRINQKKINDVIFNAQPGDIVPVGYIGMYDDHNYEKATVIRSTPEKTYSYTNAEGACIKKKILLQFANGDLVEM